MAKVLIRSGAILLASLLTLTGAGTAQAAKSVCRSLPAGRVIAISPDVSLAVRTVGSGRPVLMIPSLGRSTADFDEVAGRLVAHGFMTILIEPRGINGSTGPAPADLFAIAADLDRVLAGLCLGPVDVIGHAFGNRVARALATAHPDRVRRVVLLAGGGEVPMTPPILAALSGSAAQGEKADAERLIDLQTAFFAKGNDPSRWLTGWFPAAARSQADATRATPVKAWWNAGKAPALLVQADEDPIAPPANAASLKAAIGDRLTIVLLRHASHAILPEQPAAVVVALARYLSGELPRASSLQRWVDAATVHPSV